LVTLAIPAILFPADQSKPQILRNRLHFQVGAQNSAPSDFEDRISQFQITNPPLFLDFGASFSRFFSAFLRAGGGINILFKQSGPTQGEVANGVTMSFEYFFLAPTVHADVFFHPAGRQLVASLFSPFFQFSYLVRSVNVKYVETQSGISLDNGGRFLSVQDSIRSAQLAPGFFLGAGLLIPGGNNIEFTFAIGYSLTFIRTLVAEYTNTYRISSPQGADALVPWLSYSGADTLITWTGGDFPPFDITNSPYYQAFRLDSPNRKTLLPLEGLFIQLSVLRVF
jgi:hypothetical protein